MNPILALVRDARGSADPFPLLNSDHMIAELLALHEEMILQLRLESQGSAGKDKFFATMIEQHEKTAALLRARLARREAMDHDETYGGDFAGVSSSRNHLTATD